VIAVDWVTVLSMIFALIGGAMLLVAARHFARRRALFRHSAVTPGTIVGLAENRERDEISYFPKVKFRTPSGREVTFQSEMGSSEPGRIGDIVAVRYRPEDPDAAEVDSFMSLWGVAVLSGGLGAVFLFVGLGILTGWLPV